MGGASAMVGGRVIVVCCGCLFLVVCVAACVVVRVGMTIAPVMSYVCSLYQMRASFPK